MKSFTNKSYRHCHFRIPPSAPYPVLNFAPLAKLFPRCPTVLPGSAEQPSPPFLARGRPAPSSPCPWPCPHRGARSSRPLPGAASGPLLPLPRCGGLSGLGKLLQNPLGKYLAKAWRAISNRWSLRWAVKASAAPAPAAGRAAPHRLRPDGTPAPAAACHGTGFSARGYHESIAPRLTEP